MSASRFESFLAKIYVDENAREKFLADPRGEATRAGLAAPEIEDLFNIDRAGLELFANSLRHKKARKAHGHQTHPNT